MTQYSYFVRGAKHAAMCRTSIESVKKADAQAHFVVMTDEPEYGWSIPEAVVHHFPFSGPIMLANLEAQCRALTIASYRESVVFLDTDILMLERLPPLEHADIMVTWRDHVLTDDDGEKVEGIAATMPYNYGVIQVIAAYPAIEAFIWMRERIRKMRIEHQKWYGNQLALAELAGVRPESGERIDVRRIPWLLTDSGNQVRIAKVPGARWNWTPSKVGEKIHGAHSVLHFKGRARALMESYARRLDLTWHIETQERAA